MTVYCYRCGGQMVVHPRIIDMKVTTGRVLIQFGETLVDHQCPQDSKPNS